MRANYIKDILPKPDELVLMREASTGLVLYGYISQEYKTAGKFASLVGEATKYLDLSRFDKWWSLPSKPTADNPEFNADVFSDLDFMHKFYGFGKVKITKTILEGRRDFLQEELNEISDAIKTGNSAEVVDGLIDLIVVASGTLNLLQIDAYKAWVAVYKTNINKKVGGHNKRPKTKGMDLIKPDGWVAPNHDDNVGILPAIFNKSKGDK